MKRIQKSTIKLYEAFISEELGRQKRNQYQHSDERILTIVQSFESREIFEYLWWVEHKVMEQKGNKQHTLRIASLLKKL